MVTVSKNRGFQCITVLVYTISCLKMDIVPENSGLNWFCPDSWDWFYTLLRTGSPPKHRQPLCSAYACRLFHGFYVISRELFVPFYSLIGGSLIATSFFLMFAYTSEHSRVSHGLVAPLPSIKGHKIFMSKAKPLCLLASGFFGTTLFAMTVVLVSN